MEFDVSWRAWITFAALCVVWGVPYFFIKLAVSELSPACVAWTRITLAAAILVPIAARRGVLRPVLEHKGAVCTFAFAELVVPFFLIAFGEQWISSSLAGILIATVPLMVILIAPWFGVRERLDPRRLLGLAIGFSGVVALLGLDPGHGPMLAAGVALLLISAVGYAVGPLVVQRHLADVDELGALAASLVVASVVLFPVALATAPDHMPSMLALSSVATLGIMCTAVALLLYFYLIHETGAARASIVAYVSPAIAAILGVLVLHEPFGIGSLAGLAMILFGSWLATARAQPPAQAAA